MPDGMERITARPRRVPEIGRSCLCGQEVFALTSGYGIHTLQKAIMHLANTGAESGMHSSNHPSRVMIVGPA